MDFDGDGHNDVLSGSFPGELYRFRRNANGSYQPGEKILDRDGSPIKPGQASTAFAVDWDSDGDLDLITGNIQGQVHLVANEGTRTEPAYGQPRQLEVDSDLTGRGGDSGPIVADWDSDGRHDLLVANGDGSVVWFRNIGTAKEPKLDQGQELVEKSGFGFDFSKRQPGQWGARVKIHAVDFNGDGRLDLLLGDRSGSPPKRVELTGEQKKEAEAAARRLQELARERTQLANEVNRLRRAAGQGDNEAQQQLAAAREKLQTLSGEYAECSQAARRATAQPQRHGFVWFFARR